jgi:hypothetical protein
VGRAFFSAARDLQSRATIHEFLTPAELPRIGIKIKFFYFQFVPLFVNFIV